MDTSILIETREMFHCGGDLDGSAAEAVLDALINESDEALLADLFRAWDAKGITWHEIYSIARIMRGRCTRVRCADSTIAPTLRAPT